MRSWRDIYDDIARSSKGIEYLSAGIFIVRGPYYLVTSPYTGDNMILHAFTHAPIGGLLLLVLGLLWGGALWEYRPFSVWWILLIRKLGCVVTVLLSSALGLGTVAAILFQHTLVPGGYSSPLALIPYILLLLIALARPRRDYRAGS